MLRFDIDSKNKLSSELSDELINITSILFLYREDVLSSDLYKELRGILFIESFNICDDLNDILKNELGYVY
jgi:hypothetical protein